MPCIGKAIMMMYLINTSLKIFQNIINKKLFPSFRDVTKKLVIKKPTQTRLNYYLLRLQTKKHDL